MYAEGNTAAGMHELQTSSSLKVKYNQPYLDFIPFCSTLEQKSLLSRDSQGTSHEQLETLQSFGHSCGFKQLPIDSLSLANLLRLSERKRNSHCARQLPMVYVAPSS
jgi:hypothetical protein